MQNIFTQKKINLFKSLVDSSNKIAIISHSNPDGDAVGSASALTLFLKKYYSGKEIRAFVPNSYAKFLDWIAETAKIEICTENDTIKAEYIKSCDLIIALDLNSLNRSEHIGTIAGENKFSKKILIDHHESPDEMDLVFHSIYSSSACFLVYSLLQSIDRNSIDKNIATALYTGFITDTGGFSYSHLTPELFHAAGELVNKGADPVDINQRLFSTQSEYRVKLFGYLLDKKMHLIKDKKAAYITLSQKEKDRFKYQVGDTEGVVNYPMSISDISISALFTESDKHIRVSLRSQGDNYNVEKMARQFFNGGGHFNAAGGKFFGTLNEAVKIYISALDTIQ